MFKLLEKSARVIPIGANNQDPDFWFGRGNLAIEKYQGNKAITPFENFHS